MNMKEKEKEQEKKESKKGKEREEREKEPRREKGRKEKEEKEEREKKKMQLTLRKCIECIQLPVQKTKLIHLLWRELQQNIKQSKSISELGDLGLSITKGLRKELKTIRGNNYSNNINSNKQPTKSTYSLQPRLRRYATKDQQQQRREIVIPTNDTTVNHEGRLNPDVPPFKELPRGEDFTPLKNPFEINRAIKPTKDIAKLLAAGIFGSKKKAGLLYCSIYKHMLWYETVERKAFQPKTVTTRKGSKVFVHNWGEWKEMVRKRKSLLDENQIRLIANLYQLQIRFFTYGIREGVKLLCTGQTMYLHHRVINLLNTTDSTWALLQGTTLPAPRYDESTGKFDFDYYLAGWQLGSATNTQQVQETIEDTTNTGEKEGSKEVLQHQRTTQLDTVENKNKDTDFKDTSSEHSTTTPILSMLELEREVNQEDLTPRQEPTSKTERIIQTLFPTELVIERPKKVHISRRLVWQRWRNIVRSKNKQANRKYIAALAAEKKRKESQKLVFDYTTCRLTESELDILSKGETFCPANHKIDTDRLKTDIYYYNRKLRLHEQYSDKQPTQHTTTEERGEVTSGVGNLIRRFSRTSTNRGSKHTNTPTQTNTTTIKHRQLPSTYDPLTQNRNLNRYTNCIQEDCLLAIRTEVKTKDNIHKQHRLALKTLQHKVESQQIMITKADKGSGIIVCDYDIYIQKGTKYIEEEAGAYSKVEEIEAELVTKLSKQRNKIVEQLRKEHVIPLHTATFCIKQIKEKITGMKFYFKIHKDQNIVTTPLRPLQSCISAPTHHLSLVLTDILQPLLTTKNIPSFIYDSNHLLFRLQALGAIPTNCTIVSSDVSALYPSIPHQQGLEAIQLFLQNNTQYNNTQIITIIQALKLVISENDVMWNNYIYKQTSGVAMGTPVAVAYANIFMAWVDNQVKQQTNYIYEHIRFIDDNLFIIPEASIDNLMQIANSILPSIKYTHEKLDKTSSKGLAFLDTQLFISEEGHIEARLYTKPTDRHAYLLPSSYHPPHIVRNIPSSVFKRLRRICSRNDWFLEDAEQAKEWLINRGYDSKEVSRALEQAERLNRWDMIVKIEASRGVVKTRTEDTYNIPFIVTYNKHAKTFKQILARRQDLLNNSYRHIKVKPRVTFMRQRNLDDLLIQKALRGPIRQQDNKEKVFVNYGEKQQYRGECPCKGFHDKGLCRRCCAHASLEPIDSKVKLSKQVNCGSKNLVYLIGCRKCTKQYVGETQQTLRDRLAQHLNNIPKFNQPLYLHFRLVHPPTNLFVTVSLKQYAV